MAKRKTSTRKAARPPAARAAARPRRRSGIKGLAKIPKLTTAAAVLATNAEPIIWTAKQSLSNPRATLDYAKAAGKKIIQPDNLAKTAKAAIIGYGIGWFTKKYAPKAIKKPVAKIAQKVM